MWNKRTDMVVHEHDPYNAEPPLEALARSAITPNDTFYARNHGPIPEIDPYAWRLFVDGLVDHALRLSLTDLMASFETVSVLATLQCAGNQRTGMLAVRDIPGEHPWAAGATSTAVWTGVQLADVLAAAGVGEESSDDRHVALLAPDISPLAGGDEGFGGSIPLAKALDPDVVLAWQMNGEPLPTLHGGPVRVVVPGYIGARSVKWIQRLTVQEIPSDNYFQAVAYRMLPADADLDHVRPGEGPSLGPIGLSSAILAPLDQSQILTGSTEVAGYALAAAGHHITRVEVSLDDGGTWTEAELDPTTSAWSWRLWRTTVTVEPGHIIVIARAWDSSGVAQPESAAALWNPKGYVNNSWPRVTMTVV